MAPRRRRDQVKLPKCPKPARVKDPMSNGHIVYLKHDQKFEVFLSDGHPYFKEVNVTIKSDYLIMEGQRPAHEGRIFTFRQREGREDWSRVSTTYLGEIQFSNPSQKFHSRLCVLLQATNPFKTNIVTVVNPNDHTVKIQPFQILEVVVYNPLWGMPLYWEVDTTVDPRFEVLAHSYIQPHQYNPADSVRKINDAFFTFPRANQTSNTPFLEYHFWLRCDTGTAKHMQSLPEGYFPNGKIRFLGCRDTEVKTTLNLDVIFNTRVKSDETSDRVKSVTFEDSSMTKDIIQPVVQGSRSNQIIPVQDLVRTHGSYSPGLSTDWRSYQQSGMSGQWTNEHESQSNDKPWCSLQKYKVTQNFEPMFSGCKSQYISEDTCKLVYAI